MKIAYLSTFYPFRGGIAQFNANLYKELSKEHQIKAFNFSTQYPNILFPGSTQLVQNGDNAEAVNATPILSTINPMSYLTATYKINKFAPDMIITKFWMPFFAPSLGTVYKLLNSKIRRVAILDNVIPHEKRIGDMQLISYFLQNTDKFIVMSDTVKQDLLSIKKDAIYKEVIHPLYNHFPNKIDQKVAQNKLNIPPNKKVLLFFGFIRDYKGLDNLISAVNLLNDDYHLLICGEVYGSFDKYQTLIDSYQLNNRVHVFNKYIADNEVAEYFCAADVCVLPYKTATQSGIVGISYYFDLPVIATDTGGLKSMIEPYNSGLIIEKSEPQLIANTIQKYFRSNITDFKDNINKYKEKASWSSLAKEIVSM
ncbi:MAG TPA: glycosyltransferase [Candidatus Kapabacteria bacterium]|nr:glycosyltransferase [Candidatus Kapabacteria bacterium]